MDQLRIGTGWIELEVVSEPYVLMTYKGYAAAVTVRIVRNGLEKYLFIGAKSLANGIEPLRQANGGRFAGLRIQIAKESDEPMSPYKVRDLGQ